MPPPGKLKQSLRMSCDREDDEDYAGLVSEEQRPSARDTRRAVGQHSFCSSASGGDTSVRKVRRGGEFQERRNANTVPVFKNVYRREKKGRL